MVIYKRLPRYIVQRIGDCLFCVSRCRPLRRHFVRWRLPTAGHPGPLPEPAGGEERAAFRLQTAERHFRPCLGGTAPRIRKWRQVGEDSAGSGCTGTVSSDLCLCCLFCPPASFQLVRLEVEEVVVEVDGGGAVQGCHAGDTLPWFGLSEPAGGTLRPPLRPLLMRCFVRQQWCANDGGIHH